MPPAFSRDAQYGRDQAGRPGKGRGGAGTKEEQGDIMFGQFFALFAMIGVGYYANRKQWVTLEVNTGLGSLVMRITCPVLLFVTISGNEIGRDGLLAFFGVAGAQFIAAALGGKLMRFLCRGRGYSDGIMGMLECGLATVNNGFIGLPVAILFFGQVVALYMAAAFFGIHLYVWTYGMYVLQGKGGAFSWKETLAKILNPNCVMVFIGLLFSLTRWVDILPSALMNFLSTLGGLCTPLSLIYIGAMAGNEGFRKMLEHRDAMQISLMKVVLFPALTGLVLFFLPLDAMVKTAFFISMAMPCAAIMPMVAEQYGTGKEMASALTLLTTFFSMFTLPVCVWLCGVLF